MIMFKVSECIPPLKFRIEEAFSSGENLSLASSAVKGGYLDAQRRPGKLRSSVSKLWGPLDW